MQDKNKIISSTANLDFWMDEEEDTDFPFEVYCGSSSDWRYRLTLKSLNRGSILEFFLHTDEDNFNSLTLQDGFLTVQNKKSSEDYGEGEKHIFDLGDIPFDNLIDFAVALLKIYAPTMINNEVYKEHYKAKHAEEKEGEDEN